MTIAVYGSTLKAVESNELQLDSLDDTQSWVIYGRKPARNGIDAADINGDGRDDVIFSVDHVEEIGYIVYSSATRETDLVNHESDSVITVWAPEETMPEDSYPLASIKAAGDVNGDGIQDVLVVGLVNSSAGDTSPLVEDSVIIFGDTNLPGNVVIDSMESSSGFRLNQQFTTAPRDFTKITTLGDINADGYDDIGMPVMSDNKHWILVVPGTANNTSVSVDLDENWFANGSGFVVEIPDCQFVSPPSGLSHFDVCDGTAPALLSAVGDINNDGVDDILFGKHYPFVIYGRENWPVQSYCDESGVANNACCTQPLCHRTVTTGSIEVAYSPGSSTYRNEGIGPAGDVNGDGVGDLVLPWVSVNIVFGVTEVPECIDTDGDGWGWDGENSCQLMVINSCDYTYAAQNNDWGWNPATMQSCPPLNDTIDCDYSDASRNNGWGWNPVTLQSCVPRCIDTDGDGWGWDGSTSCRITSH